MKSLYFCAFHAERMKASESEALRCWSEIMRRGMHAYVDCRMEAAELYLGAALDIGLMRYRCTQSTMISILHITKPTDFLLELFCADIRFDTAVAALSRISSTTLASCKSNTDLLAWLAIKYERVECAEKQYMSETVVDRVKSHYRHIQYSVLQH